MKMIIVLAMHGMPPKDFPRSEIAEMMELHKKLETTTVDNTSKMKHRFIELDNKMRNWPRNNENDPFYFSSKEMALQLTEKTKCEVNVGFNEFCSPSLETALTETAMKKPDKILVVTPMLTRGGTHTEKDIPNTIKNVQKRYKEVPIVYAWPYDIYEVTEFLTNHVLKFR